MVDISGYIARGAYQKYISPIQGTLSGLEKAILGFLEKSRADSPKGVNRVKIYELTFEYFKKNDPERITGYIDEFLGRIDYIAKEARQSPRNVRYPSQNDIQRYRAHFERMKELPVQDITYPDFEPSWLAGVSGSVYQSSPFRNYTNQIIAGLMVSNRINPTVNARDKLILQSFPAKL